MDLYEYDMNEQEILFHVKQIVKYGEGHGEDLILGWKKKEKGTIFHCISLS